MELETPAGQNWNCHNCGGCCRQHFVEITTEERGRIDSQNWADDGSVPLPAYLPHGTGFRLAHTADGACVFLNAQGLCRIHAKFGEEAKPLACRIYPYAFHPGGRKVLVSLRFSCPSVALNRGAPLSRKLAEIQRLARLVVPAGSERVPAPKITDEVQPSWPDFLRFQSKLEEIATAPGAPAPLRIIRALQWLELVEKAGSTGLEGPALNEVLASLAKLAALDSPARLDLVPEPSAGCRSPFRMLVMQYARRDTGAHLQRVWSYRWTLLKAAVRFTRGSGAIPPLQEGFKPALFADVEKPFGGIPPEGDEMLTRYFRVKIHANHFCGPAYYQIPFLEGFRHLALLLAATLWLARWLAAGEGRAKLTLDDVASALEVADHHHAYSPVFGSTNFRRRVRLLAASGDIPRLIAWYAR